MPLHGEEFIDNHDLNGDYARFVYRTEGIRIWNQSESGFYVREWGPSKSGEVGTLVFRYPFDKPIRSCSVRASFGVYRDDDSVVLSVSTDDRKYEILKNATSSNVMDLTPFARGQKVVYIRFQVKGTQLNSHITTPSLLRTASEFKFTQAPNVYEFRAMIED